ncbi:MAG: HEPN domain-containing protein [Candidatus Micrarchaeia archaeon]
MKLNLSDLLRKREIEKVEPDRVLAEKLLRVASENVKAAEDNIKINHKDVALTLAYNSMLNASRALMAFKGYRAFSEFHHKASVDFCNATLGAQHSELLSRFNRYRNRRHDIMYGEIETGSVGENEAKNAVKNAKQFLEIIKNKTK